MRRVLITGASGFLGPHLVRELEPTSAVIAVARSSPPSQGCAEWLQIGDEPDGLADAVTRKSPDLVVHAAFANRKPQGWSDERYLEKQQASNLQLFERCAKLGVWVILVSSSAVYGAGTRGEATDEKAERRPVSLYGLAKTIQETLGEYAARSSGLKLTTLRLFNLIGPGRGQGTVVHDWVAKVKAIAQGAERVLSTGTLATSRDFVDVRDAARAVGLVAENLSPGTIYNVASGGAVSLRELNDHLQSLCRLGYETIETDPRPASTNVLFQCGDATRLRRACGWRPQIAWKESVRDVWEAFGGLLAVGRHSDGNRTRGAIGPRAQAAALCVRP